MEEEGEIKMKVMARIAQTMTENSDHNAPTVLKTFWNWLLHWPEGSRPMTF